MTGLQKRHPGLVPVLSLTIAAAVAAEAAGLRIRIHPVAAAAGHRSVGEGHRRPVPVVVPVVGKGVCHSPLPRVGPPSVSCSCWP